MKPCPICKSQYGYSIGNELYNCPDCGNEWNPDEVIEQPEREKIFDSKGK